MKEGSGKSEDRRKTRVEGGEKKRGEKMEEERESYS